MKHNTHLHTVKLIALTLSLGLLTGCAGTTTKNQSIEDRVNAYWELTLAGNFLSAYEYLSPGYRSSISPNQFQRSMLLKKVKWNEAKYVESDCTETACKATISVKYTVYAAVPGVRSFDSSQKIQETWVLADGIWYLVPKS